MSRIWPYVSKKNPCGVCGKFDWCQHGDRGWKCQRVQSSRPFEKGGWFHPFGDSKPQPPKPRLKMPEPSKLDASKLLAEWSSQTSDSDFEDLAASLGVSMESVVSLGAVKAFWRHGLWSLQKFPNRGWAFPMRDGDGNIIGIRVRSENGLKWAVAGSKNGIFAPDQHGNFPSCVYLCEGPTSTAAALTMGLYAIGRPACQIGGPEIKSTLKGLNIHRAVIVADNDDKSPTDLHPNGLRPGYDGAVKLAKEIGVKSVIWTPPTKDMRDFLHAGGTRQLIESEIKNFVWKIYK